MALLAYVAVAALAADAPAAKPAANINSVFELSAHIVLAGDGQQIYEQIVTQLSKVGGIQILTGKPDMIAFSFGRGRVPELRKRLEKALKSLADMGPLRGKDERLNPTFDERREQARQEIKLLAGERDRIADALSKAPLIDAYVKLQIRQLEAIDPAKEERQGVLLVIVDGADLPRPPREASP